jgi:hypothetical protein
LFAAFGLTLSFLTSNYKWEIYYIKERILNGDTITLNGNEVKLPEGFALLKSKNIRDYHMLYSSRLGNNFRLIIEESSRAKYPINEYQIVFSVVGSHTESCHHYQANIVDKEVPVFMLINHDLGAYISIYSVVPGAAIDIDVEKVCSDFSAGLAA